MIDIDNQWLIKFLLGTMESLPLGILAVNAEGTVFIYNRRMGELEGREPGQVLGKHISSLYEPDHPAREILAALKCEQPVADTCRFFFNGQGREVNLITSVYPFTEQERVAALIAVTREDNLLAYIMKKELQRPEQPYGHCSDVFSPDTLRAGSPFFPGVSALAEMVREQATKVAAGSLPVLVSGEPGTGKEGVARAIHSLGCFPEGPFLKLNCGLFSPVLQERLLFGSFCGAAEEDQAGLIELARGGTLYIEQLEHMGLPVQSRLLKLLQEKRFLHFQEPKMAADCRFITSAGIDPGKLAADGTLRRDLYLQLAGESIDIPPLRQRKTDIPVLAEYYLQIFCRHCGCEPKRFSEQFAVFLQAYSWPGNNRELAYAIETAIFLAKGNRELKLEHLPPYLWIRHGRPREQEAADSAAVTVGSEDPAVAASEKTAGGTLNSRLLEFEKQVILKSLAENEGNVTRTASMLGLARQNLQYRMRKLRITGFKPD